MRMRRLLHKSALARDASLAMNARVVLKAMRPQLAKRSCFIRLVE